MEKFTPLSRLLTTVNTAVISLELMQLSPECHLPEPFDIVNHAGNMGYGGINACVGTMAYTLYKDRQRARDQDNVNVYNGNAFLTKDEKQTFNRFGVAAICGATALMNCVTETKWGVKHLPVAEMLGGTTADPLDLIYSTVWAGIASLAFWKKNK
jgi:hypothetical protein